MAKKKKPSWLDKLKKKVKKILTGEREKNQNLRDRYIGKRLRKSGMTEKDIKKMGYGGKK